MKRLIAAGILTIFLITTYFSGFFYIKNTCEETNRLLSECVSSYEKNSNPSQKIKNLKQYWENREKRLSIFTNHSAIDEIELSIHTLLIYSKSSQQELFYDYSDKIRTYLHQIMEDTVPSAHSIL